MRILIDMFSSRKWMLIGLLAVLVLAIITPCLTTAEYSFSSDADAIENAANSVFMLEIYGSNNQRIAIGSGFLAFENSVLITNYHVIEDGAYVIAISDDGDRYLLKEVCAEDKQHDLAILRFEQAPNAVPLKLDYTSELKRSNKVVAIGSPAGLMNTISIGNISAFYNRDGKDWIQFTAPISSGSSGGALFNDQGFVIGVTTATYASTQNVNMAVKAKYIDALYRAWNGNTSVLSQNLDADNAYDYIDAEPGSSIVWVTPSGTKYHNSPSCSRMKSPREMDLLDAIEQGYEPCGKCYR